MRSVWLGKVGTVLVRVHACRSTGDDASAGATVATSARATRASASGIHLCRHVVMAFVMTAASVGRADEARGTDQEEADDEGGESDLDDSVDRDRVTDHAFGYAEDQAGRECTPDAGETTNQGGGHAPQKQARHEEHAERDRRGDEDAGQPRQR